MDAMIQGGGIMAHGMAALAGNLPPQPAGPSPAMKALHGALAKAAAEFQPIAKNRSVRISTKAGGAYQFRYADLEAVIAATRPALSKYGLAVVQPLMQSGERMMLTTTLVHEEGGIITSSLPVPGIDGKDPKEYGALITYLRRYMLTALLNVAADDDLDDQPPPGNRSLSVADMAELLDDIAKAKDGNELRDVYSVAVDIAAKAGDADAVKRLTAARDARIKAAKAQAKEPDHAAG